MPDNDVSPRVRILFIGDIVGRPGRKALKALLPTLKSEFKPHLIIANVENAAGGAGITEDVVKELIDIGVHVMTSGNHIWDKRETLYFIEKYPQLLRPINFHRRSPGRGYGCFKTTNGFDVLVVNAIGRLFTGIYDSPYDAVEELLSSPYLPLVKVLDFHAETTSEKLACAFYFAGRISMIVGTHTHIQTSDERVLKDGTLFITDVGMTGSWNSVIGIKPENVIQRIVHGFPSKYEPADDDLVVEAVLGEIDPLTGKGVKIIRIRRFVT